MIYSYFGLIKNISYKRFKTHNLKRQNHINIRTGFLILHCCDMF